MKKLLKLLEQDCTMPHDQMAAAAGMTLEEMESAIAEYEKLSSQEGYGSIFRRLAQEEQEQLLFLLQ